MNLPKLAGLQYPGRAADMFNTALHYQSGSVSVRVTFFFSEFISQRSQNHDIQNKQ